MRYLLILALLLPVTLLANTITVTSNANAGTGSLREAITNANANANADTIKFSISDVSEAGRTIILDTELPYLYSNLTIDGTTQPGTSFGVSNTKIKIQPGTGFPTAGVVLFAWENLKSIEVANVSIYGLFINDTYVPGANTRIGIRAINSLNIKIGGLNKGNVVNGFETGIFLSTAVNKNSLVEYNWIGLNAIGSCGSVSETNGVSISTNFNRSIVIQHNFIFSYSHSILFNLLPVYQRTISIFDNSFGTDVHGQILPISTVASDKKVINISNTSTSSSPPVVADTYDISITKNVIVGKANAGVWLNSVADFHVTIDSNIIGTNSALINPGSLTLTNGVFFNAPFINPAIQFHNFKIVNNQIYYCALGISRNTFLSLWVSNNSFFCNTVGMGTGVPLQGLGITITSVTSNSISGTREYPPGVIEIYSMKDCGSSDCQGFKKLAEILPTYPSSTNWSYCGYLEGRIVVTQFTGDATTSNFSNCMLSPNNPVITDADCSGSPGSIKGVVIPANATISWRNINRTQISTSNDLINVPAGKYYYSVVSTSCSYTSDTFEIKSSGSPVVDTTNVTITPDICNARGSITNIKVVAGNNIKWINSAGNVVSTDTNLVNFPDGRYRLSVGSNNCLYQTQWYTIGNFSPKIDTTKIVVTNTSCGKSNGAISYNSTLNLSYSYSWANDQNVSIANNKYSVSNLPSGNYYFNITRDSAGVTCFKQYGPYKIVNQSGPSIDVNNIQLTNASCSGSNGSIKNIVVTNSTGNQYFRWEDSLGNFAGNSVDLLNVAAGKYKLKYKDGGICDTITTAYFNIKNDGAITIDTTKKIITPTGCNLIDGSITNVQVTGATTFEWINTQTNTTVGSTLSLQNVPAGNYKLKASNTIGCNATTNSFYVPAASFLPLSVITYSYKNASCDLDNGYLQSFTFSNSLPYSFTWVDSNLNTNISTSLNISNLKSGNYLLKAKDTNNCEQKIFSKAITQLSKPNIDLSMLKVINDLCTQQHGSISGATVSGGAGKPYTWEWFDSSNNIISSTSSSCYKLSNGRYYFNIKDSLNCSSTSPWFTVANDIVPISNPIASDQLILRGSATSIVVSSVPNFTYFLYDTVSATIPISTNTSGIFKTPLVYYDKTFYLKAGQGSCLSNLVPVKISVFDGSNFGIPNAFSPNGDGINDVWRMGVQGIIKVEYVIVYNRNGQEVFKTTNSNFSWDGTNNGEKLPSAAYFYILKGSDPLGKKVFLSGSIVLLR